MLQFPADRDGLGRQADARHPESRRHALLPPRAGGGRRHGSVGGSQEGPPRGGAAPRAGSTAGEAHHFLDRLVELLERRRLSPTELRVLLSLHGREKTLSELAEELDQRPRETRRAGRALSARGLVRWHHVGRRKRTTIGLTPAGLATMRPLLTAAGQVADVGERTSGIGAGEAVRVPHQAGAGAGRRAPSASSTRRP